MDILHPPLSQPRRRSVDVGGLSLALGSQGLGQGWVGWDESEVDTEEQQLLFAELLSDMYNHTHTVINAHEQSAPIDVSFERRAELIRSLDKWHFEPHKLPEHEVLYCSLVIFEALFRLDGILDMVPVSIDQIRDLLFNMRHVYRHQNSYHNFEHAVDVLQAIHMFLCSAGRVPPASILLEPGARTWKPKQSVGKVALVHYLTPVDLFCLYVASIGHDVGHPGVTNSFMKNAQAPLSSLYDHNSPLEQLHYTLLLHILRRQGFGFLLDNLHSAPHFRKLLAETVLATDMRVHTQFMERFQQIVDGAEVDHWTKRVLVCQALIKAADISNPCRPINVSQHWASALQEEWTSQATLERHLHMIPSVKEEVDPLSEAKSQVWFIETFAKPLFDLTASGIPETAKYADNCSENLAAWKERTLSLSTCDEGPNFIQDTHGYLSHERDRPLSPPQAPEDYVSAFPMALPTSFRLGVDQSDRSSVHDWASFSASSAPVLTDTDSSRASSPTHVAEAPNRTSPPSLSITSISTNSSISSPSPSITSTSQSAALTDAPVTPGLLASTHDGALGLMVSVGTDGSGSSAAAIRAAYKVSVRKKPSFHRYSWSSGLRDMPARREMAIISGQGIES
ncbi:hypothetical protein DFH94DRAFT_818837 [Russula ochroleuca]|jgi:hypothetical protein|uniref:Phosphodiesterase n=1 Tax=Russula ochroleuca TaxID=152965 RepID=A0A9P5TB90_9AGAM|nr:hypothetical protein DFH94DRAFT_818837 [Russula ochroleuca]